MTQIEVKFGRSKIQVTDIRPKIVKFSVLCGQKSNENSGHQFSKKISSNFNRF